MGVVAKECVKSRDPQFDFQIKRENQRRSKFKFCLSKMASKSSGQPSKPSRKQQPTPKPRQKEKDPVEVRLDRDVFFSLILGLLSTPSAQTRRERILC